MERHLTQAGEGKGPLEGLDEHSLKQARSYAQVCRTPSDRKRVH